MKRKQFSNKLYDEYDVLARQHFKRYLEEHGVEYVDHPFGKYGIDIAGRFPDGGVALFDVEVRPIWRENDSKFPFDTIHLPERKGKYLRYNYKGAPIPTYFIAFRRDYKAFVVIDADDVDEDILIPVKNRYVSDGELFFDIDTNKCKTVYI